MDQFRYWIGAVLLTLLLAAAGRSQELTEQPQVHLDVLAGELQLDTQRRKFNLHQRFFQNAKNFSRCATSNESVSCFTCEAKSTMRTLALLRELGVIDVVSKPQCVTTAGRTAKVQVGQNVPVAGKKQTVGLQLEMTPSFTDGKRMRLQFDATYSYWVKNTVKKTAKGSAARIATRQLAATADIAEGQALVIVMGSGSRPKNDAQRAQKSIIYVVRPKTIHSTAANQIRTKQRTARALPNEIIRLVEVGPIPRSVRAEVEKSGHSDLHIVPNPKKALLQLSKGGVSFECKDITISGVKGRRVQVASMGRGAPMRVVGMAWQAQAKKLIHSPTAKRLILEGGVNLSYTQRGSSVSVAVERVVIDLETGQMNYSASVDLTEDPNTQPHAPSAYSHSPYSPVTRTAG